MITYEERLARCEDCRVEITVKRKAVRHELHIALSVFLLVWLPVYLCVVSFRSGWECTACQGYKVIADVQPVTTAQVIGFCLTVVKVVSLCIVAILIIIELIKLVSETYRGF